MAPFFRQQNLLRCGSSLQAGRPITRDNVGGRRLPEICPLDRSGAAKRWSSGTPAGPFAEIACPEIGAMGAGHWRPARMAKDSQEFRRGGVILDSASRGFSFFFFSCFYLLRVQRPDRHDPGPFCSSVWG